MVTGVAISELVDPPARRMKFDIEELHSPEAQWYKGLTKINDRIGTVADLKLACKRKASMPVSLTPIPAKQRKARDIPKPPTTTTTRIVSIEEIVDDDEIMEVDDLVAYEKPDSDAEDEDEDPTLVQRKKHTAPVYVPWSLAIQQTLLIIKQLYPRSHRWAS